MPLNCVSRLVLFPASTPVAIVTSYPKQDPSKFCDAFDNLTEYIEREEGWKLAAEELTARKVAVF